MTTKILTGTYPDGYTLKSPITVLTVAAAGYVEGTGVATSSTAAGTYAVVNLGRVVGATAAKSNGVYLAAGGGVTNGAAGQTHARIAGYSGILVASGFADVENFATIQGESGKSTQAGVYLKDGGVITNGSAGDTTAAIVGGDIAINVTTAAATVTNFGSITAANSNIYQSFAITLGDGGTITNGGNADTTALIEAQSGVDIYGAARVTNFGTIEASGVINEDGGLVLAGGGELTNGSLTDSTALIEGYTGLNLGFGTAVNFGAIVSTGGEPGVIMAGGAGTITNGAAGHTGALIKGGYGVFAYGYKDALAVVTNFATIDGTAGHSVYFLNKYSVLNVEAGSTFIGSAIGADGTLVLAGGVGTIAGAELGVLTVSGDISPATFKSFGVVSIAAGAAFSHAGPLAITAGESLIDGGALTLSGTVANAGRIDLDAAGITVAAAGLSLAGAGKLVMSGSAANKLEGATAASKLTLDQLLQGAGQLGDGRMALAVGTAGTVESLGSVALTVNIGTATIANSGHVDADSAGGLTIASAIANTGTLDALVGTLTIAGVVSGTGRGQVAGGTLKIASSATFDQNVTFSGTGGALELAHGLTYTGTISGFSLTGTTALELDDVTFKSGTTKASYSGSTTSGVLTITSGSQVARIHFAGDYLASKWTLGAGPGGGTKVVDPSSSTMARGPFVQAMAGVGARGPATWGQVADVWRTQPPILARPATQIA